MLICQKRGKLLSLFLDKLTSVLIHNRLNLLDLSIIVVLDLAHLFPKLILQLVLSMGVVNFAAAYGNYVSAHLG